MGRLGIISLRMSRRCSMLSWEQGDVEQGEDKRVRKNLFPDPGVLSATGSDSMELVQQDVLFSDALSDLLDQEFPLPTSQNLDFMPHIIEETRVETEETSEEEILLVEEGVMFEENGSHDVALPGQGIHEETSIVAGVGDSERIVQGGEGSAEVPPPRARLVKSKGVLHGASTKKGNMYALTSPRKKAVSKGVGLQGKAGPVQGGKPPRSAAD
ncbi:PREDICTED: uncharacterized protein LOC104757821 [Camelina sativa]|uniref:Uncharacterized protein LOC104757821 n=1 Tax=Camelina sativa TaxID=90675 RepID=A0ABM0X0P8_CAMSA|nr:PREDICTED: uncharacterized protein LOC104757821 [Camelina sativa]XP_010478912.1 PREDICTED: uncharacterized protein LOC104757821 [Camelina sativa]